MSYFKFNTDEYNNALINFGPGAADAFGRGRVATPTTLFNASFEYDSQPYLFDTVVTGNGTTGKTVNESSLTLSTGGTTSGDGVYVQSHRYYRYEPGKSQLIAITGDIGAQKTNVRSRYGYFDNNNGCYFEMDGTAGASVNIRSSTSGSPVNVSVPQASWNIDKMDGSGPSEIILDFSKTQIFIIDLQWLGVGRVRFGFDVNGSFNYCHEILNANIMTSPYMNTAVLPTRGEIFNTGTAASTSTMKMICNSIISEGGEESPLSYRFTANNNISTIAVTSRRPILSLRPQLLFNSIPNHVGLIPIDLSIYSDASILWELVYNGTLGGTPSFTAIDAANSGTDYDVSATTITGGIILDSGYVAVGTTPSSRSSLAPATINSNLFPTISAKGVADVLSIVCTSLSSSAHCFASITWEERR